ncbi:hypothetical protein Tco_0227799 [Tanacetum coccineum]
MDHYTMKALWIYWIRGDDEVKLTGEESSNNDDEIAEDYEWYEALEDCKLKNEALRNKDIMEGSIKEVDDESCLFAPPSVDLSSSGIEKLKKPEFEGYGVKESLNVQMLSKLLNQGKFVNNSRNNSTSWNTPKPKKLGDGTKTCLRECEKGDWSKGKIDQFGPCNEQGINAVKPTAYWAWRPKVKMINHVYKNTGFCVCKQFDYVDPTGQTATGKESSNPFMAGSLPKTISSMIHISQEVILLKEERTVSKDSEVCKITKADGTSSFHGDFQALLRRLDRQDLFQLYSLVQERYKHVQVEDGTSIHINMLVDKKYPLKKEILKKMINLKIEAE